jgi:hypothetical protein
MKGENSIMLALIERVSLLESEAEVKGNEFQVFKLSSMNEMQAMQQQLEQLENDKETLEERVEILEALTVKLGNV